MATSLAQGTSSILTRASNTDLSGPYHCMSSPLTASPSHPLLSKPCRSQLSTERVGRCTKRGSCNSRALQSLLAARETGKWEGRTHLGSFQLSHAIRDCVGAGRWGRRSEGVQASLLGVGAPEVLVIAVVALVVFGPKGLAEVARTLGNTLRGFQPVIKELQQVSSEFRGTLEKEMGLDELRNPPPYTPPPRAPFNPNPNTPAPYSAEDYAQMTEEQTKNLVTEDMRRASEAAAWGTAATAKPPVTTDTQSVAAPAQSVAAPTPEPGNVSEKPPAKESTNRN